MRLDSDRQGDIVVSVSDALLVCLGDIPGFTWMNFGNSFLSTHMMKIEKVADFHTPVTTKPSTPTSFSDLYRVYQ